MSLSSGERGGEKKEGVAAGRGPCSYGMPAGKEKRGEGDVSFAQSPEGAGQPQSVF